VRQLQTARGTSLTANKTSSDVGQPVTMRTPPKPQTSPTGPRRRIPVLIAVALAVLVTDIITKVVLVATLEHKPPVKLLGGFLQLRVTRNPGAAFSIGGPSETIVFALIAVGVVIFILRTSRRIKSLAWTITLGLLLGGATGNLTDRIFRWPGPLRGWVVDWIELPHWPVFNVADSCIVCGGVLAVLLAVRGVRIDGSVIPPRGAAKDPRPAEGEPDAGEPGESGRAGQSGSGDEA
jgi:signal peptidase II